MRIQYGCVFNMAAIGFPMLVAAHAFLILPLFLSSGVPEYVSTDFGQFIDPIGMALTTAHDVRVRHFGLEKLHSSLVPGQCRYSRRCRHGW